MQMEAQFLEAPLRNLLGPFRDKRSNGDLRPYILGNTIIKITIVNTY